MLNHSRPIYVRYKTEVVNFRALVKKCYGILSELQWKSRDLCVEMHTSNA